MRWWTRLRTRLVAADPGLRRLRSAARVVLGVVVALGLAVPVVSALGQPLTSVALAAVVAMISLLAVNDTGTWPQVITTLLMPLSAALSLTAAALTTGSALAGEGVFLVVMFVAVYVRRFGSRATALGMAAFIAYFLALFLRTAPAAVPAMAGAGVLGALAALLVRFGLLRERPDRLWESGVRALQARVRTLLDAMDDLAADPSSPRRSRRVQDELVRLNGTALALETDLDAIGLPEDRADALRRRLLDVELAAGALVTTLGGLLAKPDAVPRVREALARVGAALHRDPAAAAEVARDVADRLDAERAAGLAMAVRRLASSAADLASATATLQQPYDRVEPAPDDGGEEEEEDGDGRRLRPTTRMAVQVVCAGAGAIAVGGLVYPGQWFWAVITAFVVFAGTASRGELLVRAGWRTAGTLFGVVAGVLVALAVTGHPVLQVAFVLGCLFLAFYVLRVSYGLMTFFVTAMLGVLYTLLDRFSVGVLEVRLVETVVGAVAGAAAALLVLPTRTRTVVADDAQELLDALAELLLHAAADLADAASVRDLSPEARTVDERMHTLLASAAPLGSYRFGDSRARYQRWRLLVSNCASCARGIAAGFPLAAEMSDADTRCRLAALATTLAELAEAIGDRIPHDAEGRIERATEQQAELVDLVEAVALGSTSLRAVVHQLGRLAGTLGDLAQVVSGRAAERA